PFLANATDANESMAVTGPESFTEYYPVPTGNVSGYPPVYYRNTTTVPASWQVSYASGQPTTPGLPFNAWFEASLYASNGTVRSVEAIMSMSGPYYYGCPPSEGCVVGAPTPLEGGAP